MSRQSQRCRPVFLLRLWRLSPPLWQLSPPDPLLAERINTKTYYTIASDYRNTHNLPSPPSSMAFTAPASRVDATIYSNIVYMTGSRNTDAPPSDYDGFCRPAILLHLWLVSPLLWRIDAKICFKIVNKSDYHNTSTLILLGLRRLSLLLRLLSSRDPLLTHMLIYIPRLHISMGTTMSPPRPPPSLTVVVTSSAPCRMD